MSGRERLGLVLLGAFFVAVAAIPITIGFLRSGGESIEFEPDESLKVTRPEAVLLLRDAVASVRSGNTDALCALELSGNTCFFEIRTLGAVSITEPRVVGFRTIWDSPDHGYGAVVELCMKVNGQPLYNDWFVSRQSDRTLGVHYAAYWIQRRVEGDGDDVVIMTPAARSAMKFDPRCGPIITEADLTREAGEATPTASPPAATSASR